MQTAKDDLPFSARYALPAHVSQSLSDMSWETVIQLSCDYQAKASEHEGKAKKLVKELQMTRLLLMERIKEGTASGRIDPQLLIDVVHLLERSEEVANQYDIDLKEFSRFLYMLVEKLKKERLARHEGRALISRHQPISSSLARFKGKSEPSAKPAAKKK